MPRTIKIDFYQTVDTDGNALDIAGTVLEAFQLPFEARRVDGGDTSFVFLHNVREENNHNVLGEVMKGKMTDLPDKISRNRGRPEDLGLQADEGIGHRAHFYYDSANQVLMFQRDREIRAHAFVSSVAGPTNTAFGLDFIFKRDAINRLDRMRVLRKIAFTVASPAAQQEVQDLDPSAARAIDILSAAGGRQMEVSISVGRARRAGLERESVMRLARSLLTRRGEEVEKVVISGREEPEGVTEIIDLFEDRLVHEAQFPERNRRVDREALERALLMAHSENLGYLRAYRNP
jgi:hypothetical protein